MKMEEQTQNWKALLEDRLPVMTMIQLRGGDGGDGEGEGPGGPIVKNP